MTKKRLAVFISGRGSNMEAIMAACKQQDYPAEVAMVVADKADAGGIETALDADIDAFVFKRSDYTDKQAHETAIRESVDAMNIDLLCLAGYMRLLSADFTNHYDGKLINIHPSLLPKFKGLNTHARVIEAGETEHGCTVHFVNAVMDEGEVIAQAKVPVLSDDTAESLAARVLIEEHKLYPSVIRDLCSSQA